MGVCLCFNFLNAKTAQSAALYTWICTADAPSKWIELRVKNLIYIFITYNMYAAYAYCDSTNESQTLLTQLGFPYLKCITHACVLLVNDWLMRSNKQTNAKFAVFGENFVLNECDWLLLLLLANATDKFFLSLLFYLYLVQPCAAAKRKKY